MLRILVLVALSAVFIVSTASTAGAQAADAPLLPIEIDDLPVELIDPLVQEPNARSTPLQVDGPAEPTPPVGPDIGISIESENGAMSNTVLIILLLTVGAAAPSILLLTTSFTRFVIVLGLTRNALGTQQMPPNQVLTGIALFLTLFVMAPVLTEINDEALQPMLAGEMSQGEAFDAGFAPLREFMLAQTDRDDLQMLLDLRGEEPAEPEDISATVLVPAFVLSELKAAFVIGFMIFIPFLIIDLVVASVLMSMGMMMLPPVFISLPLKLLLFVMVNGWALIIGSVVESINGV
ncbi:MAG: flagellar type III secretion system pore protein FliP [Actinomycetota bacterium]|nr:flagellar type III secretion system pore protein FliP [Actinomycetota bacterium]